MRWARGRIAVLGALGASLFAWTSTARAQLAPHPAVRGVEVETVDLGDTKTAWSSLSTASLDSRIPVNLFFTVPASASALEIGACAGLTELSIGGQKKKAAPLRASVWDLPKDGAPHVVKIGITPSAYEKRVACSAPPRVGEREETTEGLTELAFPSVHAKEGGGRAMVYLPRGHDRARPSALLVGLHPWNGTMLTYGAYAELLAEADRKDVVLLMPSGLGNSLYTANAEDEVLTAIAALRKELAIDPSRVSIWGASMGGAGATTIGFHHPDRFASITSFFGDSRYDLTTYVKAILPDEVAAHRVNALDVAENVRNVPVWLVHGEDDHTSPIRQSELLASALRQRGYDVRFDRVPGADHEGRLVARFIARVVDLAAEARAPLAPRRVTFTSVSPYDGSVYGVRFTKGGEPGDASIDLERRADGVHVVRARAVRAIALPRGAFGADPAENLRIVVDDPRATRVDVQWDRPPPATP